MADNFEQELNKSEKLLKERLVKAGKIAKDITNQAFKELLKTIDDYSNAIDDITDNLNKQLISYDSIKNSTRAYGDALKSTLPFIKENKDLAQKLTQIYSTNNKLANQLVENQENLITGQLSLSSVAKDLSKIRQQQLNIELSQRDIAQEIEILNNESIGLQGEELEKLQFQLEALMNINEQLEAEKENSKTIADNLQQQAKSAADIEAKVGLGGKLMEGFKKIPILGDILDVGGAKEAMQAAAANGASSFGTMGAGIKALGPSLKAALGPLVLISIAVEAIKALVDTMFAADKQITDIAHNFGITKDAAAATRKEYFLLSDKASTFSKIQEGNVILQKDQLEAAFKMNEILGTQINFASDLGEEGKRLNTQFADTVKFLKISEEEQKGLLLLNKSTGKEIDDIKTSVLGTTRLENLKSGVLLNERKILKDVLTASNAIKLTTKGGAEGLTQAAISAAKLGTNLQGVQNISEKMLDFESSISSELEAELMTGRNLNLEKARTAALNGDISTVAQEINKQMGSAADFGKMNVLQQESLAKAVGVSRSELADMLTQQESLNNLKSTYNTLGAETLKNLELSGKIDASTLKNIKEGKASASQYFDALKKAGMSTEELTTKLGDQALKSLESQSAQDKFNDALEKAREIFTRFVDGGSLDKLADMLGSVANRGVYQTLMGGAEEESAKNKLEKAGYKIQEGSGLFGTGAFKRTSISKNGQDLEGAFGSEGLQMLAEKYLPKTKEIKEKDYVIKSLPEDTVVGAGGTKLGRTDEMIDLLKELISVAKQGGNVYLDGNKVGTAMAMGTFKTQ